MGGIFRIFKRRYDELTSVDDLHSVVNTVDHRLLPTVECVTRYYGEADIPRGDLDHNRRHFLNAAREKRDMSLRHYLRTKARWHPVLSVKSAWQLAAIVAVFTLMLFPVRGQVTVAAMDSLPGDALYLVKLAKEDSAVEYIEEPSVKALLTLSFVDERIDEITTLAQNQREIPLAVIYRTHRLLNTALGYAAWAAEDDMAVTLEEINQHLQTYILALESAKDGTTAENLARLSNMQGRCLRLQLIVTAASLEPEIFRDAYRAGAPERLTAVNDPLE